MRPLFLAFDLAPLFAAVFMHLAALLTCLSMLAAGCLGEAPHDNPLDPASDRFVNEGGLTGHIANRNGQSLANAEVHLLPVSDPAFPSISTQTNGQGQFLLRDLPAEESYRLQVKKTGYSTLLTSLVTVEAGQSLPVPEVRLNALPLFEDISLRSVHLSRWWPSDLYFLEINARTNDPDGLVDVENVWVEIPELEFAAPLTPTSGGQFELRLDEDALPTSSLSALLGRSFSLFVEDQQNDTAAAAPRQLARVIEAIPVATSPSGDVLLDTDEPVLIWDPLALSFSFSYEVQVFRDEVNQNVLVQTLPEIPPSQTSIPLSSPLPTGQYFWTVAVIDTYGNRSRSKEAAFRIP